MDDDEWNFSGPIYGGGDDSFNVAADPDHAAASRIDPETGLGVPTTWWGKANAWADKQFGPDASKNLQKGLSGLQGTVKKLDDTPQQNPGTAAALAVLKGATPAGMTRGTAPNWQAILAALQARQQQLRGTGLAQQPARGGAGLLGM